MRFKKHLNILLIVIAALFATEKAKAGDCFDYMLLDGFQPIVRVGMDTTHHWWAITEPFSGERRLIVDGWESDSYVKVSEPVFSADGERWAAFARDNVQSYLITSDTIMNIPGTDFGELLFSPNSQNLVYSYKNFDDEFIVFRDREIRVYRRTGSIFVSWDARRIAFMGRRGSSIVMNVNGEEGPLHDEIKPMGFWNDGQIMYAARNGPRWQIYRGFESITEYYDGISEVALNLYGTVAGALVRLSNDYYTGLIISDEYYEPLTTKEYTWVKNIVLHPELPMMAFSSTYENVYYVTLNNSDYYAGQYAGPPQFTHTGEDVFFIGCTLNCFVNVSGHRYDTKLGIAPDKKIAMKPRSRTIAYTSSTSLIVMYLGTDDFNLGKMMDQISEPRYNWRDGRYEALGLIRDRLYLLTCTP